MRREITTELAGIRTTLRRINTDMTNLVQSHAALLIAEMRAVHDRLDAIADAVRDEEQA